MKKQLYKSLVAVTSIIYTTSLRPTLEEELMTAAYTKNTDQGIAALESGANPNVFDNKGNTPLMICAKGENYDLAKALLQYKADPNFSGNHNTALGLCCLFGHFNIAQLLLTNKASPNQAQPQGRMPLIIAREHDQKAIYALLIKHGADEAYQNRYNVFGPDETSLSDLLEPEGFSPMSGPTHDANRLEEVDECNNS
jgi:ankyrin repeat protein